MATKTKQINYAGIRFVIVINTTFFFYDVYERFTNYDSFERGGRRLFFVKHTQSDSHVYVRNAVSASYNLPSFLVITQLYFSFFFFFFVSKTRFRLPDWIISVSWHNRWNNAPRSFVRKSPTKPRPLSSLSSSSIARLGVCDGKCSHSHSKLLSNNSKRSTRNVSLILYSYYYYYSYMSTERTRGCEFVAKIFFLSI